MTPKFKIGQQYKVNERSCVYTIKDILTTFNSKNEVVKIRYLVSHVFCGQEINNQDVCETTIARGILL